MYSKDDGDYFADQYATKINRMTGLLLKAAENGNPMAEEFAEAWVDILDLVIEQQRRTTEFMSRVTEYYTRNSQSPAE